MDGLGKAPRVIRSKIHNNSRGWNNRSYNLEIQGQFLVRRISAGETVGNTIDAIVNHKRPGPIHSFGRSSKIRGQIPSSKCNDTHALTFSIYVGGDTVKASDVIRPHPGSRRGASEAGQPSSHDWRIIKSDYCVRPRRNLLRDKQWTNAGPESTVSVVITVQRRSEHVC